MLNFNSDSALGLTSDQLNSASVPTAISGSQQALFPESSQLFVKQTSSFDLIGGGEGDDMLDGGTDKNWLAGAAGNDILIDSDGGDLMIGGEGADRFWINSWDNLSTPSTILDFNVGMDTIKISGSDVSFDSLTFEELEGKTTIYEQGNPLATLIGVDKDSLTSENFSFGDTSQNNSNQFQTIDTDIGAIKANSEDTLNSNVDVPNFNFPNIEQFFSSYISNILGNTTLQDLLTFMGGETTSDSSSSTSSYSNTGDITASLMEQQATGKPFAQVMQETTIEPSASDDKYFRIPEKRDGNRIPGHNIYEFDGLSSVG